MRKILFAIILSLYAMTGWAQLKGNGYYRLQNKGSERYAYVKDNKGSVSVSATAADLGAIQLWKDLGMTLSDPSTVIYIIKVGDKSYRFECQGTNSYSIIEHDLKLVEYNKKGDIYYKAYQSKGGVTSFLCDAELSESEQGKLGTNDVPAVFAHWYVSPVEASTACFFGIQPTLSVENDHYVSFYAEFPFSFASPGMKAYYIKLVDRGMAVLEEVKTEIIPGATPLIIKCSSTDPANNKLNLLYRKTTPIKDNLLKGVYFCNLHGTESYHGKHWNAKKYDSQTMRILSVSPEGKLVFKVDSEMKYLPANKSYLSVPTFAGNELTVVTQKEYDDIVQSGVEGIINQQPINENIYSLSGTLVGVGYDRMKSLPAGVYIMAGKKYIIK